MNSTGDRISIFANPGSQEYTIDTAAVAEAAAAADIVSVTIMDYCRQFLPMLREIGKDVWGDIHDYDGINPYHQDFIAAADYLFMSSVALPDWRGYLESRVAAGTKAAVCTRGAAGASGLTAADGWFDVAATEVANVVDTNGAGAEFFAGFATEWMQGSGLGAAMDRGAAVAAAAIQSLELAPSQ